MGLAEQIGQPSEGLVLRAAVATATSQVLVGGNPHDAVWLDGVYAHAGDQLLVLLTVPKDAPGQVIVLQRAAPARPREGTVASIGTDQMVVNTPDGGTYSVTWSYSGAAVNDRVRLVWQGTDGTAVGKVGITPAAPAAPPPTVPPPTAVVTGSLSVPAIDSGTYSPGYGWNSYYGQTVAQGNGSQWGAPSSNFGSFFYGATATQLSDATLTRARFWLPRRSNAGFANSTITLSLQAHTNQTRPGGDTSRTGGSQNWLIPGGWTGDYLDLNVATFGNTLKAGGGLTLVGSDYASFAGIYQPNAGQLLLDWKR